MVVSVIVVTYNQEGTLRRTLDSVLSQRVDFPYEVIIGDDCSADGTRALCEEYARRYPGRVRYLRRERNMGVALNYFDCIEQARGEYLADCAGDDYWTDPGKLQRQHDYLQANPHVAMVTTDWLCEDENGALSRSENRPEVEAVELYSRGALMEDILCSRTGLHLCSALYRRDIIMHELKKSRDVMANRDYSCEDLQILLACNAAGAIATLPGVTLHYSVGHDSISHRSDPARRFSYSRRTFLQALRLSRHFNVTTPRMRRHFNGIADYLWALMYHAGDAANRPLLIAALRLGSVKGGIKSRIYRALTSSPAIWRLTSKLH